MVREERRSTEGNEDHKFYRFLRKRIRVKPSNKVLFKITALNIITRANLVAGKTTQKTQTVSPLERGWEINADGKLVESKKSGNRDLDEIDDRCRLLLEEKLSKTNLKKNWLKKN